MSANRQTILLPEHESSVRNRKPSGVTTVRGGALGIAVVLALLASAGRAVAQTPPAPVISVDRARAGIALGTSLTINVAGTAGPLTVQVPYDGLDASYDPRTRRLLVTGRTAGSGNIILTDHNGNTATIAVLVAPPAGTVPTDVDVALAGTVSAPFVTARIRDAIERALVRQPGTLLDVHGVTIPNALAPGDKLEAQAGVTIEGRGAYVDVAGRTNLHVHVDPVPALEPVTLFYSDDPEYVGAQLAGVLFRGTIDTQTPARLFAYHVADGAPRQLTLALRSAGGARVEVLGTISGASSAFAYIGQQSSARFLAEHASGESAIVSVLPNTPYLIPLGSMQPGDLIETILDLHVIDGGPLEVDLVTNPAGAALPPLDGPELAGDTHGRRGVFSLTGAPPLSLAFTSGAPEPAPISVGDAFLPNQRTDGRPLGGDYGVVRPFTLHLANTTAAPLPVYLYELTSGSGGTTTTFWFAGDGAPTLVPCIDDPAQPHLIKAFALAAGETRTVAGTFMTDGAGSYPIHFGLSATAPLPVPANACAPTPPSRAP
jgi:hypothetical protein